MESVMEPSPNQLQIGFPARTWANLSAKRSSRPAPFLRAVATGIAVLVIAVSLVWGVSERWDNDMTAEESANALLVRDELFGTIIGRSDLSELLTTVAPDAELQLPGGTLYGSEGMRTLVDELQRVKSDSSMMLADAIAQGNIVQARWIMEEPQASALLGFGPSEVDDYVSGEMLVGVANNQIIFLQMTSWTSY